MRALIMIDLENLIEGGVNKQRGRGILLKIINGRPVY